jgi:hypothetical protein
MKNKALFLRRWRPSDITVVLSLLVVRVLVVGRRGCFSSGPKIMVHGRT